MQQSLFDTSPTKLTVRPTQIGQVSDVKYKPVRDILTRATGFMSEYDYTLNPYIGCSFGCTYCYAAFFSNDTEKRDEWGRWLEVKENAVDLLEKRHNSLRGKSVYMSSVTDPYQPIERKLSLTRKILEVLSHRHCPKLVVQTRSPDVVRDIDLFRAIENGGGRVQVNVTVTTDDEDMRMAFEPYCPSNLVRLRAAAEVQSNGISTCITMTPLLTVMSPKQFSSDLLDTGVESFIIQPFHFKRGKFLAGTREGALNLMAEKLGTDLDSVRKAYVTRYEETRAVLRESLPSLGEGKDGFRPPF